MISAFKKPFQLYDLYDDQALIPIHIHNHLSNSQVGISNNSNCIIQPNSCEEEIASSQSQLFCDNNCNISVNYDSILSLFLH